MPDLSIQTTDELQVRGGAGGVIAQVDDLEQSGKRLCSVALELAESGRQVSVLAADHHLRQTAPISPATFARAQAALAAASIGPGGLLTTAARLEVLGLGARSVAASYHAADAVASAALRRAAHLTGQAVGRSFGALAPGVLLGTATVLTIAVRESEPDQQGPGPEQGQDVQDPNDQGQDEHSRPHRFLGAAFRRIGGLTLRLLADHAPMTEAALPALPGFATGLTHAVPVGPLFTASVFGHRLGPGTIADLANGVGVAGGRVGSMGAGPSWFQESAQVKVEVRSAPEGHPPTGVGDLLRRIPGGTQNRTEVVDQTWGWNEGQTADGEKNRSADGSKGKTAGGDEGPTLDAEQSRTKSEQGRTAEPGPGVGPQVHVEQLDGAAGRAWVVAVPGTASWSPVAGRTPFDLTGDVRLMAGERTAAMAGVVAAMRQTGVRPGEPVLLVGHSQGGLIAASVAADPAVRREFAVQQVITSGAPIASVPVPDGVSVLAIEHSDDLVPRLDGAANADRPNWITVTAPTETADLSDGDRSEPLVAHRVELYRRTAEQIDRSSDPSLVQWRSGLRAFLDGPRTVRSWDVTINRAVTS